MKKDIEIVANLMELSANSSPKARENDLEILLVDEAEKEMIVEEMYQLADKLDDESYSEKGEDIEKSESLMFIGLNEHKSLGLDCKACGFESCEDMETADQKEDIFEGPNCIFKVIDLGLSLGYALNAADIHNVDSQLMIRAGIAAKSLGLMSSRICLGILINVNKEKSYFEE
ncbi:MAG: DUF2148 domain-containing protein [Thermoplasmatota archaeon]